jgi:hypothetical protein
MSEMHVIDVGHDAPPAQLGRRQKPEAALEHT